MFLRLIFKSFLNSKKKIRKKKKVKSMRRKV